MLNYYVMRSHTLAPLPYPLQVVVGHMNYRSMRSTFYGQGTGRFTWQEIFKFETEIWESVNALLTASKSQSPDGIFYVLGTNQPTEADTSLFGFVISALVCAA